jgi:hypothetical protein
MFPSLGPDGLRQALQEEPTLTLRWFSYGLVMRRKTETGWTEYPVSPADVATALAAKMTVDTGLLPPDTLCVRVAGAQRTIVGYRRPQKTALWLEGSDEPVRVPLPGLILIRTTTSGQNPNYGLWAVVERPADYNAKLYHAPLPNIFAHGDICWGTVRRASDAALTSPSLDEDWAQLLGTPFGNHSVSGKSRAHRDDVREMYFDLEQRRARVYPRKDLIEAKRTLGSVLGGGES